MHIKSISDSGYNFTVAVALSLTEAKRYKWNLLFLPGMNGKMFRFRKGYFIVAMLLLIIEICIALFVNDRFVRPYAGDFLAVMLLYCILSAFLDIPVSVACVTVLLFSYLIEVLQYINILQFLGLEHVKYLNIVLGHSFDWIDLIAYAAGVLVTYLIESKRAKST